MKDEKTILLVEDEAIIAMSEAQVVKNFGYNVITTYSGEDAVKIATENDAVDLILMDIDLGSGTSGPEAAEKILKKRTIPILFLTSHSESEMVEKVHGITRYGYVIKNSGEFVLRSSIEMAFELFEANIAIKKNMESLRGSEQRYRALIETTGTGYVVVDRDGIVLDANSEYVRLSGHKDIIEILGRNVLEWTAEEEKERNAAAIKNCIESGFVKNFEVTHVDKSGKQIYIEINGTIVETEESLQMLILCRDITERKKSEKQFLIQRDLGIALSMVSNIKEGFKYCLDSAISISEMDCGGIYQLDLNTGSLNLICHSGLSDKFVKSVSLYEKDSASTKLVMLGKPIYTNYRRFPVTKDDIRESEGLRAIAVMPFCHEDKVIGCLNLASHVIDEVHPQSRIGLEIISIQIGNAIARLYAEEKVRQSEERYRKLVDNSFFGIGVFRGNQIVYANRVLIEIFGYDNFKEFSQIPLIDHVAPKSRKKITDLMEKVEQNMNQVESEYDIIRKDGVIRTLQAASSHLILMGKDYTQATFQDITERKLSEMKIKKLLQEKDTLMKEVHHRIKNNMNAIKSLLSMQLKSITIPDAVRVFQDAISRLKSIEILYEKLYTTENYQDVSVKEYLSQLIDAIWDIFPNKQIVEIKKNIDDFTINTKILFPLGIIMNELLTNAMKHAFIGREKGLIQISIIKRENHVRITFDDNGIGMPELKNDDHKECFGLTLIGLLTNQINSSYTIDSDNGTKIKLEFDI